MLEIKLDTDGDLGDQVLFQADALGRISISTSKYGTNKRFLTAAEQASLLTMLVETQPKPVSLESACSMFKLDTEEVAQLARQGTLKQVDAKAMVVGFTQASVRAYMDYRFEVATLLTLEYLHDFCDYGQAVLAADKTMKIAEHLPMSSHAQSWLRKATKCLLDDKPATATIWLAKATVWLADHYLVTNAQGRIAQQLEEYREMVS